MAYIQPNSSIYLYNNIELQSDYKDTLWFDTLADQNTYFTTTKLYKYLFTNQMYQRTNKGTLRIEKNAENLYDCNYMRFANTRDNQTKWFYAFITGWEYINENVTEISYEIDVMQSYLFDLNIEPSFVVRQHSTTDVIGDNIIMEDINVGTDYVVADESVSYPLTLDALMLTSLKTVNTGFGGGGLAKPSINNNVPTTLAIKTFLKQGLNDTLADVLKYMYAWLEQQNVAEAVEESVVSCYLIPGSLANCIAKTASMLFDDNTQLNDSDWIGSAKVSADTVGPNNPVFYVGQPTFGFGSYGSGDVHNYKLYTYPYSFFSVSNRQGEEVNYKYELFDIISGVPINFRIAGVAVPTPAFACIPLGYKGIAVDYEDAVNMTDFPTIPITVDGFQQWLSHNSGAMAAKGIGLALKLASSFVGFGLTPQVASMSTGMANLLQGSGLPNTVVTSLFNRGAPGSISTGTVYQYTPIADMAEMRARGRAINGTFDFAGGLASWIGQYRDAAKLANGSRGIASGNGLIQGLEAYEFRARKWQIRPQIAEMVDTYFDMFGYQQNKVMTVTRNARPVYTYVKTLGCNVVPYNVANATKGANASVITAVQNIYDKGITFWKASSGVTIGDYSKSVRDRNSLHYVPPTPPTPPTP